jgi:hypothetical protein
MGMRVTVFMLDAVLAVGFRVVVAGGFVVHFYLF